MVRTQQQIDVENMEELLPYTKMEEGTARHYVWLDRYQHNFESWEECITRVYLPIIRACKARGDYSWADVFNKGTFIPAGRMQVGVGTDLDVTYNNCVVTAKIEDSLESIMSNLHQSATTLSQGSGIGMYFGNLAPKGCPLPKRRGTAAGPVAFMEQWNTMAETLKRSGGGRGAMMATMPIDHPDIEEFVTAKSEQGRLTNFNVSVLVSDKFMTALKYDQTWPLVHRRDPKNGKENTRPECKYTWREVNARGLWDIIVRNTFYDSEPGVIFIDRVNEQNNLRYVETIKATNPCGEQPLPSNGTCNLGAINWSRLIKNPFTDQASLDDEMLAISVDVAVRYLDTIIDVTSYPDERYKIEQQQKRRIGLGHMGVADALAMMGHVYGDAASLHFIDMVAATIANEAYKTSAELARDLGSFPLYNKEEYLKAPFIKDRLFASTREMIERHGLRNSVLLTVAPTGSTALLADNVSSGLEPTYAHRGRRKVWDRELGDYKMLEGIPSFTSKVWKLIHGDKPMSKPASITAKDVIIEQHIQVQAAFQKWTDASISKTINEPENLTYGEHKDVYDMAYKAGLKGCTTYRKSDTRGQVLEDEEETHSGKVESTPENEATENGKTETVETGAPITEETGRSGQTAKDASGEIESSRRGRKKRPSSLEGRSVGIDWQARNDKILLTMNQDPDDKSRLFEILLNCTDKDSGEWMDAFAICLSYILREGTYTDSVLKKLKKIHSAAGFGSMNKKFMPSAVSAIATVIDEERQLLKKKGTSITTIALEDTTQRFWDNVSRGDCDTPGKCDLYKEAGCVICKYCGYQSCGD